MPPQKETHEVVDMTKQYGVKGLSSGIFEYAHHDAEPKPFSLAQMLVDYAVVKDLETAAKVLNVTMGILLVILGFMYWLSRGPALPLHVNRPAMDTHAFPKPRP